MKNLNFLKASSLLMVVLVMATFLFTSTNTTKTSNDQIIAELSEQVAAMNIALEEAKVANEMVGVEPFIGEITLFAGNFAPRGYYICDGRLLEINSNQALFSILGTTYGGDGRTSFGIPDLRGRVAVQQGRGPGLSEIRLGQKGGLEELNITRINVSQDGGNNTEVVTQVGNSPLGIDNRQPYLGVNYIIAGNSGIYPPRD